MLPKIVHVLVTIVIIVMLDFNNVEAIKCHQCNSFLEPDCAKLTLSAPTGMKDDQYLKECIGNKTEIAFCRVTEWKILASEETRTVRACGFIPENSILAKEKKPYCIRADFDWLDQGICNCFEDGCNSTAKHGLGVITFIFFIVGIFVSKFM